MAKQKNDIESLLKQNNRKIEKLSKKIENLEHNLKRFQLMNFLRFVIVAVPVIIALLLLIPIFRDFLRLYEPILEAIQNLKSF
jgi:hypothetical protein